MTKAILSPNSNGKRAIDLLAIILLMYVGPPLDMCQDKGEGPTLTVESQHTPIASPSHPTSSQEHLSQLPTSKPITTPTSPPFTEPQIPQISSMPHDSPLLGGYTPGSVEGSQKLNELMDLCTKLVDRVTTLETELTQTKKVYGKAITKLVKKVLGLKMWCLYGNYISFLIV
ncbi:hypothetical protein Tco_1215645 [Tanacetum coccineum]